MANVLSMQDKILTAPNKIQRENAQNAEISMILKMEIVFLLAKILSVKKERVNVVQINVQNAKKATLLTTMEYANQNHKTVKNTVK